MKKTVLLFVTVTVLLALGGCSKKEAAGGAGASKADAPAKTIKVKMTHTGTELTLAHRAFLVIKDELEKRSNGVFQVDIYPNGQLGNDAQIVEAVQEGDVQIMFTNTGNLLSFVPELGVFAVPFAFPNLETAYRVLDGPFGKKMLGIMEPKGMVGIAYLEAVSYRELSSNKLIKTPADLKGLKIRVMTNPIHIKIWETLGAQPTPISFAELFTALQQGTVDAQENPLELFVNQNFYTVQKHVTLTHHLFTTGMLLANPAWFNKLTPELQQVVRDAGMAGTLFQREQAAKEYDSYITTITGAGVTVTELTDAERQVWQDTVKPVNAMVAGEVGGQAIIDELFAAVKEAQ